MAAQGRAAGSLPPPELPAARSSQSVGEAVGEGPTPKAAPGVVLGHPADSSLFWGKGLVVAAVTFALSIVFEVAMTRGEHDCCGRCFMTRFEHGWLPCQHNSPMCLQPLACWSPLSMLGVDSLRQAGVSADLDGSMDSAGFRPCHLCRGRCSASGGVESGLLR